MNQFKDHFSGHAATYAQFRPNYPAALFDFLALHAPDTKHVWDCATGNGQAAIALADRFKKVTATDASAPQINSAISKGNIEYHVATAENSGLADESVSLVTVAQALHWFNFDAFFSEADRVLKPGGILACWSYGLFHTNPVSDRLIYRLYKEVLNDYWPAERAHVEREYKDITFPFSPVATPDFAMQKQWNKEQILGYLSSWSAVKKYAEQNQSDPVDAIRTELTTSLDQTNQINWPVALVVRRKQG